MTAYRRHLWASRVPKARISTSSVNWTTFTDEGFTSVVRGFFRVNNPSGSRDTLQPRRHGAAFSRRLRNTSALLPDVATCSTALGPLVPSSSAAQVVRFESMTSSIPVWIGSCRSLRNEGGPSSGHLPHPTKAKRSSWSSAVAFHEGSSLQNPHKKCWHATRSEQTPLCKCQTFDLQMHCIRY